MTSKQDVFKTQDIEDVLSQNKSLYLAEMVLVRQLCLILSVMRCFD